MAVKFGVTVAQLQEWNNISDPNSIQIGQVLQVKAPTDGGGSGASTYTVQSGDNLSSIAVKFGVTVAQLQEWNNISDPNSIQIGQVLQVKAPTDGGGSGASTYTVQSGDNLSSIAVKFGVTVAQLQEWNNISDPNSIQIGQVLQVKAPTDGGGSGASTYTVQSGDNLSSIAVKFGVTVAQLQEWNNISDPNAIQIGQVLIVG
ncbi:LysM peptidoglycan-binding domain-containing protein [Sediminibacillus dalangtanensis]|uniref:LysM peptidoglycan-binding domain-containing protein n=1 Tax=Sediminibacillus dalangtanensis TaxID=2729421 RepID=A0ABX7VZX0_9BACI|nr:LysM peptidoglycan-binding domain-containing protein [Sediminibacillus dalangtanensis]